jgi:hypothetical protein
MWFFSWLRKGKCSAPLVRRRTHASPRQRSTFRPQLEALEDRWLPSTLTVTSAADSGPGSLRAEIAAAKNNDTIVFAPSLNGQTITLTSGELDINTNLTIQGPGANELAISGGYGSTSSPSTVFGVGATASNVTLAGLSILDGQASLGAGIFNSGGLTLSGCTLSGNHAASSLSGGEGGAIYNNYGATLTVSGCTVSGNYGGDGGGIYNDGTMSLLASTVTGNSADGGGAGIFNDIHGYLTIGKKSDVCDNFVYPVLSTGGSYEVDLLNAGVAKITGSSDVCVNQQA